MLWCQRFINSSIDSLVGATPKNKQTHASHRGDFAHHLGHERQAAGERADCDEGTGQLQAELAWNITEGFELLHVSADALHVRVAELILHIDQSEHALQKLRPEVRKHVVQVDSAAPVAVVAA